MTPKERYSPELTPKSDIKLISRDVASNGDSIKYVFVGRDKNKVATFETGSYITPSINDEPSKHDICVSTAGGCTRHCTFCAIPTAELGFERLLTDQEIVHQIEYAINQRSSENPNIYNVVGVMGNGEPPDNSENVAKAIHSLSRNPEYSIDRFVISTMGENLRGIDHLTEAFQPGSIQHKVFLQFSLHAAEEIKRRFLVPGKRSLSEIMKHLDRYSQETNNVLTLNITPMEIPGEFTNISQEDAQLVAQLVFSPSFYNGEALQRKVKISAYNPIPGNPFTVPDEVKVSQFVNWLHAYGIDDIHFFQGSARTINEDGTGGHACGQLRANTKSSP